MNEEQKRVATECARQSAAGEIHFGDIVGRLLAAGVERYHADYCRGETTYYTPCGGSCVVPMGHELGPVATEFSAAGVESAVRQSQRGEIKYAEFTRQALRAGCVGYFVLLGGKRVLYFGRHGDVHTEWFPGAQKT